MPADIDSVTLQDLVSRSLSELMATENLSKSTIKHRSRPKAVEAEKVLQAASALFANLGYDGVGTREIARSCGCSVASIYYHFDSKENLYRETFGEKREILLDAIAIEISKARDATAKLAAFVSGFYGGFRQDRQLLLLILRDIINAATARPRYLFGLDHEHFVRQLREILRGLNNRDVDDHTILAIMSLIFGFCCSELLTDPSQTNAISQKDELMEMVLKLIGTAGISG